MADGYWFTLDGIRYDTRKDNGQPYTLPFLWSFLEGCAGVVLYAPDGREVLRNAGSLTTRYEHIRKATRVNRHARYTQAFRRAWPGQVWDAYLEQSQKERARMLPRYYPDREIPIPAE